MQPGVPVLLFCAKTLLALASRHRGHSKIVQDIDNKGFGALPTATGGITRLGCDRAREAGVNLAPLLKKAGLTEPQILDCGARISVHHQIRFLNLLADAMQDGLLGFHLAERPDLRELGLLYYVGILGHIGGRPAPGGALQRDRQRRSVDRVPGGR